MLGRNGAKVTEDELGVVIAFEGSEANDFTAPLDDDAVYTSTLADLAKLNFLEVKAFSQMTAFCANRDIGIPAFHQGNDFAHVLAPNLRQLIAGRYGQLGKNRLKMRPSVHR